MRRVADDGAELRRRNQPDVWRILVEREARADLPVRRRQAALGEDRVTFERSDGSFHSVPVGWTDFVPADRAGRTTGSGSSCRTAHDQPRAPANSG